MTAIDRRATMPANRPWCDDCSQRRALVKSTPVVRREDGSWNHYDEQQLDCGHVVNYFIKREGRKPR